MKNTYSNSWLANSHGQIKFNKNEVLRKGGYSIFKNSSGFVIRKGKRVITKTDNLDDSLKLLMKITKEGNDGK